MGTINRTVKNVETVETEQVVKHREVQEVEEEIEIPVCDFCDQEYPEEDPESYLTPIVVNPQVASPGPITETVRVPMDDSFREHREVYHALRETQAVDFRRKRIMESDPVWHGPDEELTLPSTEEVMELDDKEVAYEFIFNVPKPRVRDEGSIEVCEFCKEQFQ